MDISEQMRFIINQVKKIRLQKDISQMELSLRSGLSQSFLANLERGKKQPSVLTMLKIAEALDVNLSEFFPQKEAAGSREELKEKIISLVKYL